MAQTTPQQDCAQARAAHAQAEAALAALPPGDDGRRAALERRQDAARAWYRAAHGWADAAPGDGAAAAEAKAADAAVSAAAISPRRGTIPP